MFCCLLVELHSISENASFVLHKIWIFGLVVDKWCLLNVLMVLMVLGKEHGSVSVKDSWKHCLIMDEVDGMAGNEDRGGVQASVKGSGSILLNS